MINSVLFCFIKEDAVVFKTENNAYYQFVVINREFVCDSFVTLYSGNIRKCGIDTSGEHYSLVNGQLTFDQLPDAERNKSLFYNHYTDRLIFKDSNGDNRPLICGTGGSMSKSYATDVSGVVEDLNTLLTILKDMKIVNLI